MIVVEGAFVLLLLRQDIRIQSDERMTSVATREITMGTITSFCFFFGRCIEQGGKCIPVIPLQSLPLPLTETPEAFAKTPTVGTSPKKLLNDKFRE